MPSRRLWRILVVVVAFAAAQLMLASSAFATQPQVKVVPWVASNSLIPHDTWSGKTIHLKGTADVQGANFSWIWDFGDGSPVATGTVSNKYDIEATHAYSGTAGTILTARLTVTDTNTGDFDSKPYFVKIQNKTLPVEVNVAIDEGLWYLHTTQYRTGNVGYWNSGYAGSGYYGITTLNINAFEVNGHLESGDPSNPYVETVARGLRQLFAWLYASGIAIQTNPLGTFSPDSNGNGVGVFVNQGYPYYQGGMFVDAIVASGTPDAVTTTGPANVIGRTYKAIVQDMVDGYAWAQYDYNNAGGGWRYSSNEWPDNSACQWAAIALIPAERNWGVTVPAIVKNWNKVWLNYSKDSSGRFGYTDPGYFPWGTYATTPSGMVQMVMDGIYRGDASGMWEKSETFMRNNFGNGGGASVAVKGYYYGLFSFVKSLLLHPDPGHPGQYGIKMLHSTTPGVPDIDWYYAEVSKGDLTDGVARTLVDDQSGAGYWYGHNYSGDQYPMETGIAIIILNRTIFAGGAPVAVATATPNPAVVGATVTLDGTASFHQDPARSIVAWDWEVNHAPSGPPIIEHLTGPIVTTSFATLGTYSVKLTVTDDASTPATADTTLLVLVSIPPLAPTANAGGPYSLCPAAKPWFLDGSKSANPDEGVSEPGHPGDTIYGNPNQFQWNLGTAFGDAIGQKPDVTAWFTGKGVGSYLITLKVTDTTATSFPSSGQPNLSGTAQAYVYIKAATDPACATCITNLAALSKNRLVQLTWPLTGADHYNIYRSNVSGGPYLKIGTAVASQTVYFDYTVTNGATYYYVVRPATIGEMEVCQSNEVIGRPRALR